MELIPNILCVCMMQQPRVYLRDKDAECAQKKLISSMTFVSAGTHWFPGTRKQHMSQLSYSSGWFLVRILMTLNEILLTELDVHYGIRFQTKEMVQNGWYRMYLSENQANYIVSRGIAELYPVDMQKAITLSSELYRVHAVENWSGHYLTRISKNIYVVDDPSVISDPQVLSIEPHQQPELLNRYSVGYILDGNEDAQFQGNKLWNVRHLHTIGLDGRNIVVGVVDSGIDPYHCMFYDPEVLVPVNETNPKHRKIIRLDAIADDKDAAGGHGTHVCGILAGKCNCQNCGIGLYDGAAPGAKIYMHDLGNLKAGPGDLGDVDLPFFMSRMRLVESYITSNSWGLPENTYSDVRMAYSEAAFENPDILFVFATGNSRGVHTINVPGNSKNVLSVGATSRPRSSGLENKMNNTLYIHSIPGKVAVEEELGPNTILERMLENPISVVLNEHVVPYQQGLNGTGKIITIGDEFGPRICDILQNEASNAAAVITKVKPQCACHLPVWVIPKNAPSITGKISVYPEVTSSVTGVHRTLLSSQGPSDLGYMKPEVVVPGENVVSARAGNPYDPTERPCETEYVTTKTGTSMAAPAVSGLMAMSYQYFVEGWYPKCKKGSGKSIKPMATLLRALVSNAADPVESTIATGYGVPVLEKVLGFQSLGLKFANNRTIRSNKDHVYKVYLENGNLDFRVCVSYLDPPLPADTTRPLFADLDLIVIDPKGEKYIGNDIEDSFATTEKVLIQNATTGTYKIHIISSAFPQDMEIPYSLVVNGGFAQDEDVELEHTVSKSCDYLCNGKCINGTCVCDSNHAGTTCNATVNVIGVEGMNELKLGFKKVTYHKFTLTDNTFTITGDNQRIAPANAVFCVGLDGHAPKVTDHNALCVRQIRKTFNVTFSNEDYKQIRAGNEIFLTVYAITSTSVTVKFSVSNVVITNWFANVWSKVPSFMKIIILVSIMIGCILGIALMTHYKKPVHDSNNMPMQSSTSLDKIPESERDERIDIEEHLMEEQLESV